MRDMPSRVNNHSSSEVLCSVVSVCAFVYLFVSTITPEPLEISSHNFLGIILWLKGRTSSKMAIWVCAGGDFTSPMFYNSIYLLNLLI